MEQHGMSGGSGSGLSGRGRNALDLTSKCAIGWPGILRLNPGQALPGCLPQGSLLNARREPQVDIPKCGDKAMGQG